MRRALRMLTVGALAGLALVIPVYGQSARVRVEADSVRVGERFRLVLRVESASGAVVPPAPGPVGELELIRELGRGVAVGAPLPPGMRVDSFTYEAAAFALDTLLVPPLRAGIVTGAETLFVASDPVPLRMRRLVADSTATLRPTRPLEGFGLPWALIAGVAALGALLGYALLRAWQRHRARRPAVAAAAPPAPATTPRARFQHTLDLLEKRLPGNVAEARVFSLALAEAVRAYADEQAGVHAREMTSATLVRALERLERARRAAPGSAAAAKRLLAVADLGRYASTCPPPADTRTALESGRALAAALDPPKRPAPARPAVPVEREREAAKPGRAGEEDGH